MYYTSEGESVKRYDVCNDTRLSDFASGLPGELYALRLLPTGGLLVVATEKILRLDENGNITQTYNLTASDYWFALNLDPDGKSFWSASYVGGGVYKFDIESGRMIQQLNSAGGSGIIIKGEITGALTGPVINNQTIGTNKNQAVNITLTWQKYR